MTLPQARLSSVQRLLQSSIMGFLDVSTHINLRALSKEALKDCDEIGSEFYPSLWETCCSQYGLYHPIDGKVDLERLKNELWPHAKKKWGSGEGITDIKAGESFNVNVMARMRPGRLGTDKVNLPLHQFLKLKRRENLKAREAQKEENSEVKKNYLGEEDPEEFVCPFTQTLMREPVLLTHCNRVVDRSIVAQGRDPWTGRRISPSSIVHQPELQRAIVSWRLEKEEKKKAALELDREAIKEHIIEQQQGADPILLKALLEAEAIAQESDRIFRLGNRTGLGEGEGESNEDSPTPESNAALEIENADSHTNSTMNSTIEADARDRGKKEEEEEEEDIHGFGPRDDSPRILDVSEAKSIISMHVGGAGVKSFDFDKVFPGDTTQDKFYQMVSAKTVTLALHGYNACFLAYGQTG
ncbi:MAG: U-box domain-containing protein, partial [Actinomycetota bacterium]|nr:U-box domain-containing protein [Actinomycetota bacterium]